jgi:hypothetical protein
LYNLWKHNQNQEDKPTKPNNRIAKQTRAMLALLKQEEFNIDNQEVAFTASTKDKEII